MVQLIPIEIDYDITKHTTEPARFTLEATIAFMKKMHAIPPWISYLAKRDDEFVGICAFREILLMIKLSSLTLLFQTMKIKDMALICAVPL
ncbi:MAG: hypothetical protein LBV40_06985 [Methanomicrobiales archaeon]|jgi:hypothetical protein|nr:hypothetical protein [Methanomicrobiales archaeon]